MNQWASKSIVGDSVSPAAQFRNDCGGSLVRCHAVLSCLAGLLCLPLAAAQVVSQQPLSDSERATAHKASRFAPRYPVYSTVEGQPIDGRPPEKSDDKPLFPEQTRAPYRHTAPYKITTLTAMLHAPWGMAFLPGGEILITERLPGAMRILDQRGVLSGPLGGLEKLSGAPETGLLDVALDPHFARNHRIFFTFFEFSDKVIGNTKVARARLAGSELTEVKVIFRSSPPLPNKDGGFAGGNGDGRPNRDCP